MTERVDKPRRIFETSAKKLKIKSQERKNIVFGKLLKKRPLTSILTLLQLSQLCARVHRPSGHFVFFCSRNFYSSFFFKVEK